MYEPHPTCAHCGGRINLFECLWRELRNGEVRASYALDLNGLQRHGRRLWHVGCLHALRMPYWTTDDILPALVEDRELVGAAS